MVAGKTGISVGNQQFTVRNLTVNNAVVGEYIIYHLSTITLTFPKGIDATWSWGMDLVSVSRMTRVHVLPRLDLPACIHQQLLGIYRRLSALSPSDIPSILRLALA